MIKQSTWVLLAIFAILLAAVLLLPQLKGKEAEPTPTLSPALESPFSFAVADVVEMEVVGSDGIAVVVQRDENSTWKLVEPEEETSETNNIEGVVAGLVNINLITKIDPAPPAEVSGLNPAMYVVTLLEKNGAEESFRIGALTPTSSGYYIQTNDGQVYVADTTKINQVIELLQNPPIYMTPTPILMPEGSDNPEATSTP